MTALVELFLFALAVPVIVAIDSNLPAKTNTAEDGSDMWGWTPRPTMMPDYRGLVKRDLPPDNTLGYISGLSDSVLTCNNFRYAGIRTDYNVAGCCDGYTSASDGYSLTGCDFLTECVEQASMSNCDADCQANTQILKCTEVDYPYCMHYLYTDIGDRIYDCDEYTDIVTDIALTYAGEYLSSYASSAALTSAEATFLFSSATTDDLFGSTTIGSGTASSTAGSASSTISQAPSSQTSPITPVPPKPTSHVPVIAGAAVGGVLGLAAIAGIVFVCLRKNKKNPQPSNVVPSAAPAMVQGPPQGPPMQQQHDNNQKPYIASAWRPVSSAETMYQAAPPYTNTYPSNHPGSPPQSAYPGSPPLNAVSPVYSNAQPFQGNTQYSNNPQFMSGNAPNPGYSNSSEVDGTSTYQSHNSSYSSAYPPNPHGSGAQPPRPYMNSAPEGHHEMPS